LDRGSNVETPCCQLLGQCKPVPGCCDDDGRFPLDQTAGYKLREVVDEFLVVFIDFDDMGAGRKLNPKRVKVFLPIVNSWLIGTRLHSNNTIRVNAVGAGNAVALGPAVWKSELQNPIQRVLPAA
jgi:hypothetical protein